MSGFTKPKPIDFKDTNCAAIGSADDKAARKAAADTEPAWAGCGQAVGLEIWRIEKFKVVAWPKEQYGEFHAGDAYIVLNTWKDPEKDKLNWDIHFWLGLESTQDEQGTAAYKTVELDAYFNDAAVQHREVMKSESPKFKALFESVVYLDGGVDTGFNKVEAGAYHAKLFQFKKLGRTMNIVEVKCNISSVHHGDAFVLDAGGSIYVWSGKKASGFEKNAANQYAEKLESQRAGKAKATQEYDEYFWESLGGAEGDIAEDGPDCLPQMPDKGEGVLFKISDESGKLRSDEVGRGDLKKSMLGDDDVYLCDTHSANGVLVWVGANASQKEKDAAMSTASNYLQQAGHPFTTPVTVMKQGHESKTFLEIFD